MVNSKTCGLKVLFRIINITNYREVDIEYITPKYESYQFLLSNKVLGA